MIHNDTWKVSVKKLGLKDDSQSDRSSQMIIANDQQSVKNGTNSPKRKVFFLNKEYLKFGKGKIKPTILLSMKSEEIDLFKSNTRVQDSQSSQYSHSQKRLKFFDAKQTDKSRRSHPDVNHQNHEFKRRVGFGPQKKDTKLNSTFKKEKSSYQTVNHSFSGNLPALKSSFQPKFDEVKPLVTEADLQELICHITALANRVKPFNDPSSPNPRLPNVSFLSLEATLRKMLSQAHACGSSLKRLPLVAWIYDLMKEIDRMCKLQLKSNGHFETIDSKLNDYFERIDDMAAKNFKLTDKIDLLIKNAFGQLLDDNLKTVKLEMIDIDKHAEILCKDRLDKEQEQNESLLRQIADLKQHIEAIKKDQISSKF